MYIWLVLKLFTKAHEVNDFGLIKSEYMINRYDNRHRQFSTPQTKRIIIIYIAFLNY